MTPLKFSMPASGEENVGETERAVSALVGAALVGAGLARRSWGGALLAVGGAMLVKRGVTGFCEMYDSLGRSTARSAGGRSAGRQERAAREHRDDDLVDEASAESFPASDPPGYVSRGTGSPDSRSNLGPPVR